MKQEGTSMNRRRTATLALLCSAIVLATALPKTGFSQSDPWLGTWHLNLAKSKFSPGPPPRSLTHTLQGEGETRKFIGVSVNAAGNPGRAEFMHIYDGMPHPSIGAANFDATAYTRVDANTIILSRLKAGKLVLVETVVVSPDGKTWTATRTGIDANGRSIHDIAVYDKQ
jgi:hypothetical protein